MSLPWLSDPRRPMVSPRELPNLAAWFDALDTSTMLAGDGSVITDGGAVALWKDKSGNSGVNALVLNGVAGNYASTPDTAGLSIVGDIDISADVALDDWTPSGEQVIISKWLSSGTGRSYALRVATNGALKLYYSTNGTEFPAAVSTAAVAASDFGRIKVRVTLDVDNGAGGANFIFYTSTSANLASATWTKLGNTVTVASVLSLFDNATAINVGSTDGGTSNGIVGEIYRTIIKDGIAGTTVLDIDFTAAPTKLTNGDTFVCTTSQTVTLNSSGATGARIAGERDLFMGTAASRPLYSRGVGTGLIFDGTAGATVVNVPAFGTGDFTIDIGVTPTLAADSYIFDSTSTLQCALVYRHATANAELFLAGTKYTLPANSIPIGINSRITITRSSTNLVAYGNGASIFSVTSSDNIVSPISEFGESPAYGAPFTGTISHPYAWTRALSAGEVLTLYQGGAVSDTDIELKPDTVSQPAGGLTWYDRSGNAANITLPGSGVTWQATGNYPFLFCDGVDDYWKTALFDLPQPVTVYAVLEQITWTSGDYLLDGSASDTLALIQTTATPQINLSAGSSVAANTGLALATPAVVTIVSDGASSLVSINRGTATTGNAGAGVPNGLTVASKGTAGSYGNQNIRELAVYRGNHDQSTRHRWALYAGRYHGISV